MKWLFGTFGLASAVSLLIFAGCSGSGVDGQGGSVERVCTPGREVECTCPAGFVSARECFADGSGFGSCLCGASGTNPVEGVQTSAGPGPGPSSSSGPSCSPGIHDGDYVIYVAVNLSVDKPITFFAHATTTPTPGGPRLALTLHTAHQSGVETSDEAAVAPDGSVALHFATVVVPPDDDTVVPGQAITANDVVLQGVLCDDVFSCGDVTGRISQPLPANLSGSTWTMQPASAPLPTRYTDCAMDIAP